MPLLLSRFAARDHDLYGTAAINRWPIPVAGR